MKHTLRLKHTMHQICDSQ